MELNHERRPKSSAGARGFLVLYSFFILVQHSDNTFFSPQPDPDLIKSRKSRRSIQQVLIVEAFFRLLGSSLSFDWLSFDFQFFLVSIDFQLARILPVQNLDQQCEDLYSFVWVQVNRPDLNERAVAIQRISPSCVDRCKT